MDRATALIAALLIGVAGFAAGPPAAAQSRLPVGDAPKSDLAGPPPPATANPNLPPVPPPPGGAPLERPTAAAPETTSLAPLPLFPQVLVPAIETPRPPPLALQPTPRAQVEPVQPASPPTPQAAPQTPAQAAPPSAASPPAASPPASSTPAPTPPSRAAAPTPSSPRPSSGGYFLPGGRQVGGDADATTRTVAVGGADAAAEAFYRTYLQLHAPGVPDAARRARLRAHLTPALDAALAAADKAEQLYRTKTKGEAPPLIEGDLFTSLADGASSFMVQECLEHPPAMHCLVQLTYLDPATQQKVEWTDTLIMLRQGARWRVSDIAFGGKFALGQTGLLTEILAIVVKEAKE